MALALPSIGAGIPRRHNAWLAAFGRFVLRIFGWRFEGSLPDVPKLVAIVAPHTSNWDFVIGVAAMWALEVRVAWIGKHTLFVGVFDRLLRGLGGMPVDRANPRGVVPQVVSAFEAAPHMLFALAPQGTRKPVTRFRSGYYHIARSAHAPILPVVLDFGARVIRFLPLREAGGDAQAEQQAIEALYRGVQGRRRVQA